MESKATGLILPKFMIMFKKVPNSKAISLILSISFLFTDIVYACPFSRETLRIPSSFQDSQHKKRIDTAFSPESERSQSTPAFIKIATAGQEMVVAEIEYPRDVVSKIENASYDQRIGNIIYNEDFSAQFLAIILGDGAMRNSPQILQSLRPFLKHIIDTHYKWSFHGSPFESQYIALPKLSSLQNLAHLV